MSQISAKTSGTIALCPHKGCAFKCCDFHQMVHILLAPGELEQARAHGQSLAHLEILDSSFHGGARVRCRAKDTATCDGGYKPLDCISYPFFPEFTSTTNGKSLTLVKGGGCPLATREIPAHQRFVEKLWQDLLEKNPAIAAWIESFGILETDAFDSEPYQVL